MAVKELRFVEEQRACSYLPTETASLEYRLTDSLTAERYSQLLVRGWRRHGMTIFRPACPRCTQCRSLRVPVKEFHPSKSQRRVMKRGEEIEVFLGPASLTQEHIDLYNRYHVDMSSRRGWRPQQTTFEDYARSFLVGNYPFAFEMQYRLGGALVGLGLIDILPDAMSSVYFYHEPELRKSALGVFSLLTEIEICGDNNRDWLYLGYWIERCPSMAYKADYRPHQLLDRYVEDDEEPDWQFPSES